MHCALGDVSNLRLYPGIVSQLVDAFLPNHGRIHVRHQQLLVARSGWMGDHIDFFPALIGRSDCIKIRAGFDVGGVSFVDPTDEPGVWQPRQRSVQQSFVEPSGCYQRRNGQSG